MTKTAKTRKLSLAKDTMKNLDPRDLNAVAAAKMALTKVSNCVTACIEQGC